MKNVKALLKTKLASVLVVVASVVGLSVATIQTASAEIPSEVTTALEDAGTDVATLGGAVLLVVVAIVAFKFLKRAF